MNQDANDTAEMHQKSTPSQLSMFLKSGALNSLQDAQSQNTDLEGLVLTLLYVP